MTVLQIFDRFNHQTAFFIEIYAYIYCENEAENGMFLLLQIEVP